MSKRLKKKISCASALVCGCICIIAGHLYAADYPSWWSERSVIDSEVTTNDYAAVNAGQVKWFATNAYDELEAGLPGGAGTNVESIIDGFSTTNNYYTVNIGQLKAIAAPMYDRLIEEGYTNSYPWTTNTISDDADYSAANIGQVKQVFSFDVTGDSDSDGLADWVETGTSNYVSSSDTGSDPNDSDSDDDGIEDGDEVDARTDPNNSDTNAPTTTITYPANGYTRVWVP